LIRVGGKVTCNTVMRYIYGLVNMNPKTTLQQIYSSSALIM